MLRSKVNRLQATRKIVETKDICTHEELTKELRKLGYQVTQATVSRDISELNLKKVKKKGRNVYSLPEIEEVRKRLQDFDVEVQFAENLIVLKMTPGAAQGVAVSLDKVNYPEILGTIAGDDTILMIAKTKEFAEDITNRLIQLRSEKIQHIH